MSEAFANNAATLLNGGIDDTDTTAAVDDTSTFPPSGDFRIKIDDEIMLANVDTSTALNITRAQEGTSAASHADNAPVTHILTAGALDSIRVPAAGDNGQVLTVDDGSVVWATPSGGTFPIDQLEDATANGSIIVHNYSLQIYCGTSNGLLLDDTGFGTTVALCGQYNTIGESAAGTTNIVSPSVAIGVDSAIVVNGSYVSMYGGSGSAQCSAIPDATDEASAVSAINSLLAFLRTRGDVASS